MDHRSWRWRKRSSEKTILSPNKVDLTLKRIDEEVQRLPADKEMEPENSMKNLNEKLASVLLDCHPKDSLLLGQDKPAAEAALVEKEVVEKPTQLDAALMENMQHLNIVREEEEQKIREAVMKTSSEFEKAQKDLEKNLAEANKSLAKLASENSHLNKALAVKEKLIDDLNKQKSQSEAEFNTLMARLDTIEKENAFLKYEHRILEKELEIRNEEMEYTRRSVEAAHKQQLESVKQITKLEAECQRLQLLMQKKLPGGPEMRRRKLNPSRDLIVRETIGESSPESSSKIGMLERLHDMEEENRSLKEIVTSKSTELQASRMMYSRAASRLSCIEAQFKELCKGRKTLELPRYGPISSELSIKTVDNGSEDSISSPGSWATALISELEHFKVGKIKNQLERKAIEVSDMSLMDDFVEMEKLAVVSMETPCVGDYYPDSTTCKELVPVVKSDSNFTVAKQDMATEKSFDWLQVVLNAILKQKCISKQSLDELLEDIRIALGYINRPTVSEAKDASSAWIESLSENEVGVGMDGLRVESNVAPMHHQKVLFQTECVQSNLQEENKRLKDKLKNMEAKLESATDKSQALMEQLHESEENIRNLESEVRTLKESKEMFEDQIENQKSINEDLDTQLTVSKAKLSEVFQKFSSLEIELEYKHNCCEELEATCLELQLQLESVAKKETPKLSIDQDGKVSQNDWEITAASVKLAECQETILNLGKQLKALASPRDAALFDKVFSTTNPATTTTTNNKKLNKHFSLRDQMLAEDGTKAEVVKSPKDKGTSSIEDTPKPSLPHTSDCNALHTVQVRTPEAHPGSKNKQPSNTAVGSLALVPSKKRGVGLLMKLLLRRKNRSSKNSRSVTKV
ncbi:hypothetical protein LWI29_019031 [Acer saccharum]|uniref:Filament-like plant protein 7 n=1 Tax=Acer saccharum TaxID=4024 RepID=A0AA39VCF8_ACESA|nr:hypothetical protein LWI29_019031 [Acer saccharum]